MHTTSEKVEEQASAGTSSEMSISRIVSRLSPVSVVTDRRLIPTFARTALPSLEAPHGGSLWRDIAAQAARDHSPDDALPLTLDAAHFRHKRLVVFGEQHQQRSVLKAQLATLSLFRAESGRASRRCHLVLEHFNILQTDLLRRFADRQIDEAQLVAEYAESREGFDLRHYIPLLLLARELDVPVHGGFPPREWAAAVNRQGVLAARSQFEADIPDCFDASRWEAQVCTITDRQVSYLESMMADRPATMPPQATLPPAPSPSPHADRGAGTLGVGAKPTGDRRSGYFTKGLFAAQALKDTFFAWSIDAILAAEPGANVLAVCGLGHCEFGIGLLERLYALNPPPPLRSAEEPAATTTTAAESPGAAAAPESTPETGQCVLRRAEVLLMASKDSASGEYLNLNLDVDGATPSKPEQREPEPADSLDILADLVVPYDADD